MSVATKVVRQDIFEDSELKSMFEDQKMSDMELRPILQDGDEFERKDALRYSNSW